MRKAITWTNADPVHWSIHYTDVIMTTIASQITSLTIVYPTVYSDADHRKHQSSASLAFVWGIHRDRWIPRTKGQLRGKWFHLMTSSCLCGTGRGWVKDIARIWPSSTSNIDVSTFNYRPKLPKQIYIKWYRSWYISCLSVIYWLHSSYVRASFNTCKPR